MNIFNHQILNEHNQQNYAQTFLPNKVDYHWYFLLYKICTNYNTSRLCSDRKIE